MKFLKNYKGFTLVELMTAIAIAGAITLVVMTAQKQVMTTSVGLKQNVEINDLISRLTTELTRADVCSRNFGNNAGVTNNIPITPNQSINQILNASGRVLISKNQKLGDASDYINVDDITLTSGGANKLKVTIFLTPRSSKLKNAKANIQTNFVVLLNTFASKAAPTVIDSCFSDTQVALESAVLNACQGYDVYYRNATAAPPYGSCERAIDIQPSTSTTPVTPVGTNYPCPDGEVLSAVYSDSTLTNKKKLLKCAKIATSGTCGRYQYLAGVTGTGAPDCRDILSFYGVSSTGIISTTPGSIYLVNLSCSSYGSQYIMVGIDSTTNTAICINPNISQNCPAGQYATGLNSSGTPICSYYSNKNTCGAGTYMTAIDSVGNVTCQAPTFGSSCGAGSVANGVNAAGNVTCVAMPN